MTGTTGTFTTSTTTSALNAGTVNANANATVAGLTVNANATISGNITVGNLAINSNITGTVSFTGANIILNNGGVAGSGGTDEGGQLNFATPATNSTLSGPIAIDIYQNKLRFFETAGTNRGVYIDLTAAGTSVGTNLLSVSVGSVSSVTGTANQITASPTTGAVTLSLPSNVTISNTLSADIVSATNNGNGTNFKVGDDVWIGDVNLSNTMRFAGQQDSTQAYIIFGSSNGLTLGRSGTGALTYQGAFTAQGGIQNTPIGNSTANTGAFTTVTAATVNAATIEIGRAHV